jgi:hypothetical protein
MRHPIALALGVCGALAAGAAASAETGTLLRVADLKARPYLDADTVAKLPERAALEVLVRQGPWMQVRYQGRQGYVRMLQVRLDASDASAARSIVPGPTVAAASRPSPGTTTVTTGVRGFDEQALKDAQPAPEQYRLMATYAASAEQAQGFARAAQLTPQAVPYYDENGRKMKGAK